MAMSTCSGALSGACLAASLAALSSLSAHAAEAPIIVNAPALMTAPIPEAADAAIRRTAGGVDVVAAADYLDSHAVSLHDMLAFSPGVFAPGRWGEEVRLDRKSVV